MKIQNRQIWKMATTYVIMNIGLMYENIRYCQEKDNYNKTINKTHEMTSAEFALRMI
jgi:hypothetical protein